MNKDTGPVRAAAYYRRSKKTQEHSIERQMSQVRPYADRNGYLIVEEYIEPGIPGDEVENRPEFQRLLRNARGDNFQLILCDDEDRFGRFDVHKYGSVVDPLKTAGVRLETVAQGEVDWEDALSALSDVIRMAFKKEQSKDAARRILTRFIVMAERGEWVGRPPYGYLTDPDTKRLVLDPGPAGGGQTKADVVRWLFLTYAERDVSLGWLADELRRRGVPSPTGKEVWQTMTVRAILRNRNYLGDFHWGSKPHGKYYRYGGNGQARKVKGGKKKRERTPEDQWLIKADTHPALVERDLFEKVQAKLDKNQKRTTPQVGGGDWLLSKLMVCGHCGYFMVGIRVGGRKKYRCGGYQCHGGRFCHHLVIEEAQALDAVVRKIEEQFLNPDNLNRLRQEIRRQAQEERGALGEKGKALRQQIEALGRQINQGNENLALLPPDRLPGVIALLREWEAERERLKAQLADVQRGPDVDAAEREIAGAEALLWQLREALQSADPALVRAALREVVSKIELHWEPRPKKSNPAKTTWVFTRGLIHVPVDEEMFKLVNPATAGLTTTHINNQASVPTPGSRPCVVIPFTAADLRAA
jgi:site-specific DNA recombinase